jgi:endo-1,4-beta-xylanase
MIRMHSIIAFGVLVALIGGSAFAQTVVVRDGFESTYDGWTNSNDGIPALTAVQGQGYNSSRAMMVSGRTLPEHGAASLKGLYLDDGKEYIYSVQVKHTAKAVETFLLTLQWQLPDGTFERDVVVSTVVKPNAWTELTASYTTPSGSFNPTFFITTTSTSDFFYDQFMAIDASVASAGGVAQSMDNDGVINPAPPANIGLKDVYAKHFRVGNILNGGTANNAGIRSLIQLDYNSISAENENKPDQTMTRTNSTNTNIRAQISTGAAAIMNFCQQNNIPMRGHVLTWHGQTPDWFFVQDINDERARQATAAGARYRDIPINDVPWATTNTMNQRLESYIQNLFALYASQYPDLVFYAYDVTNEAAGGDGGLREPGFDHQGAGGQAGSIPGASPWQAIYGANSIDWIRNAFVYARRYAPSHTKLFYNDFNEWHEPKRNWIATNILIPFHRDGILDGMGMQSHVSANPADGWSGETRHLAAMEYFANLGIEVQLTELDPGTHSGQYVNEQPGRYANIFKKAMEINAGNVGKVTAICIWAPNDANTWLGSENSPALHDASNNRKPAYDAVAELVPEAQWGDGDNPTFEFGIGSGGTIEPPEPPEPNQWGWWFHDTFEENTSSWQGRGDASVATSTAQKALGEQALAVTGRVAEWHGAIKTLPSSFVADSSYSFSICALYTGGGATEEIKLTLEYTVGGATQWAEIALVTAIREQWIQLHNTNFQIPTGATNLRIVVEAPNNTSIPLYVDEVIGAVAGTSIAAPEGVSQEVPTSVMPINNLGNSGHHAVNPLVSLSGTSLHILMPTVGSMAHSHAGDAMRIRVINIHGQVVAHTTAFGSASISLAKVPAGVLFVKVMGEGFANTTPIIWE